MSGQVSFTDQTPSVASQLFKERHWQQKKFHLLLPEFQSLD